MSKSNIERGSGQTSAIRRARLRHRSTSVWSEPLSRPCARRWRRRRSGSRCVRGARAGAVEAPASRSSSSARPFLNDFTPLATSPMMSEILPLPPNSSSATATNNIQCQMLKLPMAVFPKRAGAARPFEPAAQSSLAANLSAGGGKNKLAPWREVAFQSRFIRRVKTRAIASTFPTASRSLRRARAKVLKCVGSAPRSRGKDGPHDPDRKTPGRTRHRPAEARCARRQLRSLRRDRRHGARRPPSLGLRPAPAGSRRKARRAPQGQARARFAGRGRARGGASLRDQHAGPGAARRSAISTGSCGSCGSAASSMSPGDSTRCRRR